LPDFLFDFQRHLVEWSLEKGRGAIFADCGLGKTPMQLAWAEQIVRKTNRPALILTPLAVSAQTVMEAEKFSIEARRSHGQPTTTFGPPVIDITNYEKLHHFDPNDYAAVVCDESSILKSFDGARKAQITEFMRTVPYRLLCTATAAPNDYIELGTSSEALGELGYMDMLNRFFVNDNNTSDTKARWKGHGAPRVLRQPGWRFKGHAEHSFWKWVCSWARACRRPSDLGYSDDRFILPPMEEVEHVVNSRTLEPGTLFALPATNMQEERAERRRTIQERCEKVAELVDHDQPAVAWCHLNDESALLSRLIPDAKEVKGPDSDEEKEETYRAFAAGDLRVIVTKPKIGAWGLNWQHCAHVVTFPSHSYEQKYQSVRRCWRFGQERPVRVDIVMTEGEQRVAANLRRKSEAADRMFTELVAHMNDAMRIDRQQVTYETEERMPAWL
jgi:hypothetical protein